MLQPADSEFHDYMLGTPEAQGLPAQMIVGLSAAADAKLNVLFYDRQREIVMCSDCAAAMRTPAPQGLDGILLAAQHQLPQMPVVKPRKVGDPCCSTNAGRPIYVGVTYITIRCPGDPDSVVDREALTDPRKRLKDGSPGDYDARRFPRQWAAYKTNRDQTVAAGTPLMVLVHTAPQILTPNQVEELRHLPQSPIYTVEQLAALPDTVCQGYTGFMTLRTKAQEYLDVTKADAPMARLQALRTEDQKRMLASDAVIAEQGKMIQKLQEQMAMFAAQAKGAAAQSAPATPASTQASLDVGGSSATPQSTMPGTDAETKAGKPGRKAGAQ